MNVSRVPCDIGHRDSEGIQRIARFASERSDNGPSNQIIGDCKVINQIRSNILTLKAAKIALEG